MAVLLGLVETLVDKPVSGSDVLEQDQAHKKRLVRRMRLQVSREACRNQAALSELPGLTGSYTYRRSGPERSADCLLRLLSVLPSLLS